MTNIVRRLNRNQRRLGATVMTLNHLLRGPLGLAGGLRVLPWPFARWLRAARRDWLRPAQAARSVFCLRPLFYLSRGPPVPFPEQESPRMGNVIRSGGARPQYSRGLCRDGWPSPRGAGDRPADGIRRAQPVHRRTFEFTNADPHYAKVPAIGQCVISVLLGGFCRPLRLLEI